MAVLDGDALYGGSGAADDREDRAVATAVSQVPAPVASPSRIGGLASPGSGAIVTGMLGVVNPMFRIQLPM